MTPQLLDKLDFVRAYMRIPLTINSGFRCAKHNAEIGGAPHSKHLVGQAADISTVNMTAEQKKTFMHVVSSEFYGIGVGKTFVHVDTRSAPAFWVY